MQIQFNYLCAESQDQNINSKTSRNSTKKKKFFLNESKERH